MLNNPSNLPDTATFAAWFKLAELDASVESAENPLSLFRDCLRQGNTTLTEHFKDGVSADILISARSWLVDQALKRAWDRFMGEASDSLSLVAVGGYGRGELMPASDVDLLLLLPDADDGQYNRRMLNSRWQTSRWQPISWKPAYWPGLPGCSGACRQAPALRMSGTVATSSR
jgi:glutamine synthetase adenylyltransferase